MSFSTIFIYMSWQSYLFVGRGRESRTRYIL